MKKIKIMIADDQTLMRDGLKTILDLEDDMEVIGTAENGKIAYELIKEKTPDIILMDIRMPVLNGVEATKKIKKEFPNIKVIILTTFDDDDYIIEALGNGASGYLLKDIPGDQFIQSIKRIYNNDDLVLPSKIAEKLSEILRNTNSVENKKCSQSEFNFTKREKEIALMIVNGLTNKEIAERLYISIGTVKNYITNIYSKVGVNNRQSAMIILKKMFV